MGQDRPLKQGTEAVTLSASSSLAQSIGCLARRLRRGVLPPAGDRALGCLMGVDLAPDVGLRVARLDWSSHRVYSEIVDALGHSRQNAWRKHRHYRCDRRLIRPLSTRTAT